MKKEVRARALLYTGAVSGGIGAELGGGNFWMGAGQGLIVTAFNFLAHRETVVNDESSSGIESNEDGGGEDPPSKKNVSLAQEAQLKARLGISDFKKYPGIRIYQNKDPFDATAVTLPESGIFIGGYFKGDELIMVIQHEYGHYLQYKVLGSLYKYYTKIGIPSITSTGNHQTFWTETYANELAVKFFGKNIHPNFIKKYPIPIPLPKAIPNTPGGWFK